MRFTLRYHAELPARVRFVAIGLGVGDVAFVRCTVETVRVAAGPENRFDTPKESDPHPGAIPARKEGRDARPS
ncbi:hypothetical protein [Limnoglobus roseus]|uniref:Uncharacterized protein n=1 Tax=Limnoglobus roseus TaxID=2598579 RepID=A0A5C1AH17_9BACT|nr:hypothetical protein [Limnoglobus roseus]QEL17925.1 hypothetical protein PX52LOC_04938 [Limnoglobus roseus]